MDIVTEKFYVNEYTVIRWYPKSWNHYIGLGYGDHRFGESVLVRTEHLHPGSEIDIEVICPSCKTKYITRPFYISRNNHRFCRSCAHVEDFAGRRFGALVAVRSIGKTGNKAKWLCKCDCGNEVVRRTDMLEKAKYASCGCQKFKSLLVALSKRKGDQHPMWRKDLSQTEREERNEHRNGNADFTKWSYAIKKEGNFTCLGCGASKSGELVSHHLYNWSAYPEYRYELWNGVCLCVQCHTDFHSEYGRKNNTKDQFNEWIRMKNE